MKFKTAYLFATVGLPVLLAAQVYDSHMSNGLAPYGPAWLGVEKRVSNGPHLEITPHPLLGLWIEGDDKRSIVKPQDDYVRIFEAFSIDRSLIETNGRNLHLDLPLNFQLKRGQYHWSYHSSPVAMGGVARRYKDEEMEHAKEWTEKFDYFKDNPPVELLRRGTLELLSPIEKYELLMGHREFSLTQRAWQEGSEVYERFKTVPGWIGACHGTAPAAIKHERPRKSLIVRTYHEGLPLEFFPSDIKMLLAHAWATYGGFSAMVGTRCNGSGISCFDTNPASFHITLMNLLARHEETLIIDASSREEVWNRPIVGYKIRFINPVTKIVTRGFEQAKILRSSYEQDPYRATRSPKTKYIVGIWATVTYVDDVEPTDVIYDEPAQDLLTDSSYLYDLELDEDHNIIGGEWSSDYHPDFMWVVNQKIEPYAPQDRVASELLLSFKENSSISKRLHELSLGAANNGLMLYSMIKKLQELSR